MYGMVNKGIEDLVTMKGGQALWEKIRVKSKCPFSTFQRLEVYDDAITYDLVKATSEELNLTPVQVLEAFGEFWVEFTSKEGYGPLMSMFGGSFHQAVLNLNHLHDRMGVSLPQIQPPKFDFKNVTDNTIDLYYFSTREGLAPMMTGLLKGLAKKYQASIQIEFAPKTKVEDGDLFKIQILG